ncbi:MAG: VPDSG-CTERM sorting domain-containing protein [Terrimicrobiaceae bacterium]
MKIANKSNLAFSQGMGICIAIISACMGFASHAKAVSFQGTTKGIFVEAVGVAPQTLVTTGVDTNEFTWGTGRNSPSNSLRFDGASFAGVVPPNQTFTLGTLTYFNGTVLNGTEASSVDLRVTLDLTSPVDLSQNFNFDFKLLNTYNVGSANQNADSVFLTSLFPTTTTILTIDGIDYSLKMNFGAVTGSGFSQVDKFSVLEGGTASATLIGTISAMNPPSVPDSGSTLALMAMAIVGVTGLRRYLTCKA